MHACPKLTSIKVFAFRVAAIKSVVYEVSHKSDVQTKPGVFTLPGSGPVVALAKATPHFMQIILNFPSPSHLVFYLQGEGRLQVLLWNRI